MSGALLSITSRNWLCGTPASRRLVRPLLRGFESRRGASRKDPFI
jgi:hypothetical protein